MLEQLDDDTLICIIGFLPVPSILNLRQTCTRLCAISRLRFIWQKACINQVLGEGYPFPYRASLTADAAQLERLVLHALRLGAFWLSPQNRPLAHEVEFQASTGTGVSNLRFLPAHGGRYILTVYKGIWSMITCWDVGRSLVKPRKVAEWCPKNTIFSGFVANSDPESEGALAVSVQYGGGTQSIEILSIFRGDGAESSFRPVCNIATTFRPIALKGELIAFSDDGSETVIMNWRKNTFALLKGSQRPINERFQYNRCLQIVFTYKSILVVRARSVELFPEPSLRAADGGQYTTYRPIGFHTFGWIDGVSVNVHTGPRVSVDGTVQLSDREPLSILLRAESDDPWASDIHKIEQFVLLPNPAFDPSSSSSSSLPAASPPEALTSAEADAHSLSHSPYLFPPARADQTSATVRGFLRCRDIVLGPSGTALWIQPRAARTAHLTGYDVHSSAAHVPDSFSPDFQLHYAHPSFSTELAESPADQRRTAECLCAAVFAGPLQRRRHHDAGGSREAEEGDGVHGGTRAQAARTLWMQRKEGCNWAALDYEEEVGRVALGSSDGSVTVLDLV
ncbi:hypothetical protein C8Q74DRAFT_1299863 [Fomes fomentarius]|nr:hypothetical protein C8Q74DRAFT_1299863 [Fomes fomentarius]